MRRLIVPLALLVALPAGLFAQSVADTAAKEKERREKARQGKAPAKVYTEDDLRNAGRGTLSAPASNEAAAAASATPPSPAASPQPGASPAEKTEDELKAERQQQWREQVQKTQAEIQSLGQKADQLQMQLNDLSQNLYTSTRANLANELDGTKTKLATAQRTLATLEDDGRRLGYR
jgi:DNA repair exonuclease SbcCD ATPase subunit